jgi:predicted lactoylglutathione lyase
MAKQIFVNLPVKDLNRSKEFFTALGFSINPQFSDDKGACVVIGENIFAMLLTEPFFKTFTRKEIADASKTTEVLIALDAESREAVDDMVRRAVDAGGSLYADPQDHGWMYQHSFADPDGHQWEVAYMDEAALQQQMQQGQQAQPVA